MDPLGPAKAAPGDDALSPDTTPVAGQQKKAPLKKVGSLRSQRKPKMRIKQPISYDGSLLRLFKSDYFNIHLCIEYLQKYTNPGIIDYLVNTLYGEDLDDIDFYVTQLVYLCITRPWDETYSLRKFILDMCIKYANLAFKVSLYLFSFVQDKGLLTELAEQLSSEVEQSLVTNELPQAYRSKKYVLNQELRFHFEKLY